MEGTTFSGETMDEALSRACEGLRARVGELTYELEDSRGPGEVTLVAAVDPIAVIGLFLAEMFRAGGIDLRVRLEDNDETIDGELEGAEASLLTAAGGQGLDALQYLCNRVLDRRIHPHPPVHLDTDSFKSARARRLGEQARQAAATACRQGCAVTLSPMTPAARREIHLALAEDDRVETESDGSGFVKRVVIRPRRRR